ncbi:bombyxin A-1 homolog [Galleria mellonella]|uniref:Bombyxin A-1 homolog n=1 Tax=Galleria mellonella TaxID=7137 RepID=A0AA50F504_GALME|nr:bombyxin A-1 homolog [Galleria mellonella]WLY76844.1 insulin-like peptide transcript variant X9 [Galleria mellonella]
MKLQTFFYAFIIIIVSLASTNSMVTSSHQYFCGRRIPETLALFCPFEEHLKRSLNGFTDNIERHDWPWPAVPKTKALEGMRSKRQGVAAECCDQPCALSELLSYC